LISTLSQLNSSRGTDLLITLQSDEVMVPRPKSPPSSPDNCGIDEGTVALPFPGIQAVYPLDDPLHSQSLEFFKKGTGIHDAAELKRHIMEIREQAYKHFPYPCTWGKCLYHFIWSAALRDANNDR
jgi:hypothetical protein